MGAARGSGSCRTRDSPSCSVPTRGAVSRARGGSSPRLAVSAYPCGARRGTRPAALAADPDAGRGPRPPRDSDRRTSARRSPRSRRRACSASTWLTAATSTASCRSTSETTDRRQPRLRDARRIVTADGVRVETTGDEELVAWVAGSGVEHRVRLTATRRHVHLPLVRAASGCSADRASTCWPCSSRRWSTDDDEQSDDVALA